MKRLICFRYTPSIVAVIVTLGTVWLFHHPFIGAADIVAIPLGGFTYIAVQAIGEVEAKRGEVAPMPEPMITIQWNVERHGCDFDFPFGGTEEEAEEIEAWAADFPFFAAQRLYDKHRFAKLVNTD